MSPKIGQERSFPAELPLKAKVIMLGESGAGKTSICYRHTGQALEKTPNATVGSGFIVSKLVHSNREVYLQIWDTAGQERFRSMMPLYTRGADAVILVFDVTDRNSFKQLDYWINEPRKVQLGELVMCLLANKCDLIDERVVTKEEGSIFAERHNCMYFETSAVSGASIGHAMYCIAGALLGRSEKDDRKVPRETIQIDVQEETEAKCCNLL